MEELLGVLTAFVIISTIKIIILEVRVDKLGDLKKKVDDLHKSKFY